MKLDIKHLAPYLPYGLKYYPSEKSDVFHDAYADNSQYSSWNYIVAVEAKEEYALKLKNSYLIQCDAFISIEDGELFLGQFKSSLGFDVDDVYASEVLPILRPMSDLNKMIPTKHGEVNLVLKLDLVKDEDDDWCNEVQADQCESPSVLVPINSFNWWLFEYHFDVFGLIEKGLAIDINTIEL